MPVCLLLVLILFLQGCTTYSQSIDKGLTFAHNGNWQAAESALSEALDSPEDRLLYLLETGALAQYQGNYSHSNQLLEAAEEISDTFFNQSFSDRSWALLTNPRQGSYRGNSIERVYISYFKSLNYLALAEQTNIPQEKTALLDAALVESRRIDLKLDEITRQTPSYSDIKSENKSFLEQTLHFFSGFYTGALDRDKYAYRDDAWARYMEGLLYEVAQEYDDARISYQTAAILYEEGYAQQYDLPTVTAERAWLDTIRMMKKTGGWSSEYPKLIKEKLTEKSQAILAQYNQKNAEVVLLEHQGFLPAKQEMSVLLYGDPQSYSLVLEPFFGGHLTSGDEAQSWFTMVYADINPLSMIANYKAGKSIAALDGFFTKRVILGSKVWKELSRIELDDTLLSTPLRVTIPYYHRFSLDNSNTQLSINPRKIDTRLLADKKAPLPIKSSIRMASLADIAVQEQLNQSQRDIYESLLREVLRAWLAHKVAASTKDEGTKQLLDLLSKVAIFVSSAAETRNWLTLPAQVRLIRQPLDPGEYDFSYLVNEQHFSLDQVKLRRGSVKVWNIRNPN
ncbi:hypothetical protein [Marinomonas sp. 2405UD68-3]|uniref:hypothetical protein n=1 Tax=Marinomonas sp. 2405UD68-3 TaxID=3391835 RepID=UPI0039C9DEC7